MHHSTHTALTALSSDVPPMPDVAHLAWPALTVRVAWTLLAGGVRVRPAVLRDARDHVLMHLPPDLPLTEVEDRTTDLVARFVARARRRNVENPWPQDAAMPLSPRWRRAVDRACTPLLGVVFRQHYGDGRSLDHLEKTLQVDRSALEAARGGLREVLRRVGGGDGLPLEKWPAARLDRLLARLAAWAPGPCPPILEVAEGQHREHVTTCTRCDRAYRLVQNEILSRADLVPPAQGARPSAKIRVLAVHFHPDARRSRDVLAREASFPCFPVGEDLLLLDYSDEARANALIVLAVEVGMPHRDHLRVAALEGPGRWSSHGLLGPLVERAEAEIRMATWGEAPGLGILPPPLPEAPSARRWWTAVASIAALGVGLAAHAVQPARPTALYPLTAQFTEGRGGAWTTFDVDDHAFVTVIRLADGALEPLLTPRAAADKAQIAVGDGTYRLHTQGEGVIVVSSGAPIPDLDAHLAAARTSNDPMGTLEADLHGADPRADVKAWDVRNDRRWW